MKILVVGNGGREHAILWKLRRDAPAAQLYVARGNAGTDALATSLPLEITDAAALASWAEGNRIDLTVVGPEAALDAGIADVFARRGLALFGPTKDAAAIETSKAYAKHIMKRAGVPTAAFATFTEYDSAEAYIRRQPGALVVKASGLAAGKGALVCDNMQGALAAARAMLREQMFGAAGQEIVVEERLTGEELSVLAIADGDDVVILVPAQDHKRIGESDTGVNTGGMGAYAPVSLVDDALLARVRSEIFLPTLAALKADKRIFRGLLYAGLMLTSTGPKVIEFNARFGDPETQVVLPLLESSLLELLLSVARGERLSGTRAQQRAGAAVTTVLAARGYPESPETGKEVTVPASLLDDTSILVFHAGTKKQDGRVVSSGGRVLAVTGLGRDIAAAAERSRAAANVIQFDGKYFRRDIGWRELARNA